MAPVAPAFEIWVEVARSSTPFALYSRRHTGTHWICECSGQGVWCWYSGNGVRSVSKHQRETTPSFKIFAPINVCMPGLWQEGQPVTSEMLWGLISPIFWVVLLAAIKMANPESYQVWPHLHIHCQTSFYFFGLKIFIFMYFCVTFIGA